MARAAVSLAEFRERLGQEVGVSGWITVDQSRIDTFAEATLDHQFIHVDPVRAAETPFGGTIAHGFLTLSLLSRMNHDALPPIAGAAMALNYGFDNLRFLSPVRAGRRVRGRFTLSAVKEKGAGRAVLTYGLTVEIEGEDKPALVADWLTLVEIAA